MNQFQQPGTAVDGTANSNRIIIKGFITGVLILALMIPTFFISNLVSEREARQNQVANDVSNKWATAQTISGPYLFIPYVVTQKGEDGKSVTTNSHFLLLPETASVSGTIKPEQRLRSIYKVLLYKAFLQSEGRFQLSVPKDIDPGSLKLSEARICIGLSDFKGIEQLVTVKLNGTNYDLTPGLPATAIDSLGLSAPINLSNSDLGKPFSFSFPLQLKGSKQLHFIPLAGDSHFSLRSEWPNPSFDGNTLPSEREVNERGFSAKWSFNKINLPFGLTLANKDFATAPLAFGVTMIQPADQYAKTERCVKYAILFIGLTFGLFFIIELLQKNPVHPVQYVLVGLALIIFYTLLLSVSEFIPFDYAYIIAAFSTITLITLYAKGHFHKWGTAFVFGALLTTLYGFIFVLIRLEDTALLIGSIGLFLILSLIMYYSRRIRWYQYSS